MSDGLAASVAQAEFPIGDVDGNLATIDRLARDAARTGSELVVLPELAPTGYSTDADSLDRTEPLDGPIVARLAATATLNDVALVTSVLERDGDRVYDTGVVLDSAGRLVAAHRKTHLFGDESGLFAAGDRPVTTTRVGSFEVAVLVCYEAEFPEMVRAVALAGADLVVVPTATSTYGPGSAFARQLIGARATENNLFVAYANHCGSAPSGDYMGGSLIACPRAVIAAEAGTGPEVCSATLRLADRVRGAEAVPYLADRRADLYPPVAGQPGSGDGDED